MPIFKTPQDTYIARGFRPNAFVEGCQEIQIPSRGLSKTNFKNDKSAIASVNHRPDPSIEDTYLYAVIDGSTPAQLKLPQGFHPTVVPIPKIGNVPKHFFMVGDVRPFVKVMPGGQVEIVALKNYLFTRARTLLSTMWANNEVSKIAHISPTLAGLYGSWIADSMNNTYRLNASDPGAYIRLRTVAAYFYKCLHSETKEVDPSNVRAVASVLARQLNIDVKLAEQCITECGVIEGIEDFIIKMKKFVNAPQMQELSLGVFITKLSSSWHGFGGPEAAICGVEHPPTFVAMVYMAFIERGYKTAGLAVIMDRFRRQAEAEVVRGVERLCKSVENSFDDDDLL